VGAHFARVLENCVSAAVEDVVASIGEMAEGERALFTMNDEALVREVNGLRWDKFKRAAEDAAREAERAAPEGDPRREEVAKRSMREWYEKREGGSEEMAEVLECYWGVCAARFVDNVCMLINRRLGSPRLCPDVRAGCLWLDAPACGEEELERRLDEVFEEGGGKAERRRELQRRIGEAERARGLLDEHERIAAA
jgi:hypothetical protein